jgi:hypothetical protein
MNCSMTQKRWKQVEAVFEQALELPVGERANFVQTTCDGDEELAREVESLLDSHTRAGSFIDRPRVFLAVSEIDGDGATIASGQVIGAYWVARELGRGGMGVPSQARRRAIPETSRDQAHQARHGHRRGDPAFS